MLDEIEFLRLHTHPTNFILKKSFPCTFVFKMEDIAAAVVVLSELLDSDDEKPVRGKTREWVKRRNEKGYYNNIVKELKN